MKMKEIDDSYSFEEYLDNYLERVVKQKVKPNKFDRTVLYEVSSWLAWLNDENMIKGAYIRTLEKQVKELGGHTR